MLIFEYNNDSSKIMYFIDGIADYDWACADVKIYMKKCKLHLSQSENFLNPYQRQKKKEKKRINSE